MHNPNCQIRKLLSVITLVLLSLSLKAQDVHLSQHLTNPLFINPAQTANSDASWRLMDNYRTQWRSVGEPFTTNIFAGDKRLYVLNQKVGIGGVVINDKSGAGELENFSVYMNLAFERIISRFKLRGGTQLGYVMKQFDKNKLTFPNQYDRTQGGFNNQFSSNESFASASVDYFDISVGFLVSRKLTKDLELGMGWTNYHLNQPEESFTEVSNKREAYYNWQMFGIYQFNEKVKLLPFLSYSFESKASQLLLGSDVQLKLENQPQKIEYLIGGIYTRAGFNRNFDAAIVKAGLGFNRIEAGVSYDINLSGLKSVSGYRGALEFSLVLKGPSTLLNFNTVPCERL